MRVSHLFSKEIKKLGFGLMRLPKKGLKIDIPRICELVDTFMDAGFTYFDTARVYPGSEEAANKALVKRKPRETYQLATKLFGGLSPTKKSAQKQLEISLKKTGAGYFDCYLLHALMKNTYKHYDRLGLWEFASAQKQKGLIRHIGFSFHSSPKVLEEILTVHPEAEFVMLQINYADWENPRVCSRANYEVARRFGKPVLVMEPLKGGMLANPPAAVKKVFDSAQNGLSYASWGIRFAAGLPGVVTVLSGMSDMAQMCDNISYMQNFKPFDETERAVMREAMALIGNSKLIGCTGCGYCLKSCQKSIPIPEIFSAVNTRLEGDANEARNKYEAAVKAAGAGASDCIGCKRCEAACPQHLQIAELLIGVKF